MKSMVQKLGNLEALADIGMLVTFEGHALRNVEEMPATMILVQDHIATQIMFYVNCMMEQRCTTEMGASDCWPSLV